MEDKLFNVRNDIGGHEAKDPEAVHFDCFAMRKPQRVTFLTVRNKPELPFP